MEDDTERKSNDRILEESAEKERKESNEYNEKSKQILLSHSAVTIFFLIIFFKKQIIGRGDTTATTKNRLFSRAIEKKAGCTTSRTNTRRLEKAANDRRRARHSAEHDDAWGGYTFAVNQKKKKR